ncbi:MAG: hypothetical protein R6W82_01730 [bacterium]
MSRPLSRSLLLPAVLVCLTVIISGLTPPPTPLQAERGFATSNALPDLTWDPVNAEPIKLRGLEGHALLIMFLDPNMKACVGQLDLVRPLQEKYEPKGLKVITICASEPAAGVHPDSMFTEKGLEWPLVMWHETSELEQYGISDLPVNVIADREGKVLNRIGAISKYNVFSLEQNLVVALR